MTSMMILVNAPERDKQAMINTICNNIDTVYLSYNKVCKELCGFKHEMVLDALYKRAEILLKSNISVVIDAENTQKCQRECALSICPQGVKKIALYYTIGETKEQFEPPTVDEGFDEVICMDETKGSIINQGEKEISVPTIYRMLVEKGKDILVINNNKYVIRVEETGKLHNDRLIVYNISTGDAVAHMSYGFYDMSQLPNEEVEHYKNKFVFGCKTHKGYRNQGIMSAVVKLLTDLILQEYKSVILILEPDFFEEVAISKIALKNGYKLRGWATPAPGLPIFIKTKMD